MKAETLALRITLKRITKGIAALNFLTARASNSADETLLLTPAGRSQENQTCNDVKSALHWECAVIISTIHHRETLDE